jgi:hypothetical protein
MIEGNPMAREATMRARRITNVILIVVAGTVAMPGTAQAQDDVSIRIEKHARLTSDGGVRFRVHLSCGPLPGTEDFREGFAGAGQAKTEAEAEGALSPDIVCDGVERVYTAGLSPITESEFVRGPAGAGVSVIACNVVGDDQVCIAASTQRRIIISGRLV